MIITSAMEIEFSACMEKHAISMSEQSNYWMLYKSVRDNKNVVYRAGDSASGDLVEIARKHNAEILAQGNTLTADFADALQSTGVKHDADKLPLDLLDPDALSGLAAVLQFGARKYAAHNWRGGLSYTRLIAALLRHLFAILRGIDIDEESGLPHIDHIGCCWMFLSNMMKNRPDMDDRHKV